MSNEKTMNERTPHRIYIHHIKEQNSYQVIIKSNGIFIASMWVAKVTRMSDQYVFYDENNNYIGDSIKDYTVLIR